MDKKSFNDLFDSISYILSSPTVSTYLFGQLNIPKVDLKCQEINSVIITPIKPHFLDYLVDDEILNDIQLLPSLNSISYWYGCDMGKGSSETVYTVLKGN